MSETNVTAAKAHYGERKDERNDSQNTSPERDLGASDMGLGANFLNWYDVCLKFYMALYFLHSMC